MKPRTVMIVTALVLAAYAAYKEDLAAAYVAAAYAGLMWSVHAIEVKINRLLDHCGIIVSPHDIANN